MIDEQRADHHADRDDGKAKVVVAGGVFCIAEGAGAEKRAELAEGVDCSDADGAVALMESFGQGAEEHRLRGQPGGGNGQESAGRKRRCRVERQGDEAGGDNERWHDDVPETFLPLMIRVIQTREPKRIMATLDGTSSKA